MKIGLVGTGPWAHEVHGPGLAASEEVELVAVWGRRREKAEALARQLGTGCATDFDALLADVDAVAFAVPPDVQAPMALRAAEAGKHLLLEKPVATDLDVARGLATAARESGIASVVFFTDRFSEAAAWIEDVRRTGGWVGGAFRWLAALDAPGNPYAESAWRRERGALWDIGPHALSTLSATLGAITAVEARGGIGDLVHLVLTHESGATSTATLSLQVLPDATDSELVLWGAQGLVRMPPRGDTTGPAYRNAVARLVAAVEGSPGAADDPVDVSFGVHVTELLHTAERRIAETRAAR